VSASRARIVSYGPPTLGLGTLLMSILALELLIRAGAINRYIVPLPSQIVASFGRVVSEEDVLNRFLLTAGEALAADLLLTVVGVGLGALLHRFMLLRAATETWVAALAAAPFVLMYPLFLVIFGRNATTIIMIGFVAGLAPVILKTT
jgi:NitT/TauT family transport system permease protein